MKGLLTLILACFAGLPTVFCMTPPSQRVVIIMMDGFGEEYYRSSDMPFLNHMEKHGIYKVVPSLMPSVTNVNNAAICTGVLPEKNGITGNSYFDTVSGKEEFMEDPALLLAPTIFQRADRQGVRSALFSSKQKTIELLSKGSSVHVGPESASAEWTGRVGAPPPVYSREVNYWLMNAALWTMQHDTSIGLFYIHVTDYPMHTWAAEETASKEHLHTIDSLIGRIAATMPDAMILITADHTVKHKDRCLDLERACTAAGLPVRIALSVERDKFVKHHRGFGGTSYVYLKDRKDLDAVRKTIAGLKGVEKVMTREEFAREYHQMQGRIGDLVVLGDEHTVFGNLDSMYEDLPAGYRTHGSTYEAHVPLFVYNARQAPPAKYFTFNYLLTSWLY